MRWQTAVGCPSSGTSHFPTVHLCTVRVETRYAVAPAANLTFKELSAAAIFTQAVISILFHGSLRDPAFCWSMHVLSPICFPHSPATPRVFRKMSSSRQLQESFLGTLKKADTPHPVCALWSSVIGYVPKDKHFSFFLKRYLNRHHFPPAGVM